MTRRRRLWIGAAAIVGLAAAALVAVFVVAPRYVRDRAIEAAKEHGVALTIGDVGLALDGITLRDVAATTADLQGVQITAREIAAPWSPHPTDVTARGVEVSVRGPFAALRRGEDGALGRGSDTAIHVQDAHVVWAEPMGKGSRIEIAAIAGEASHGELHLTAGALTGVAGNVHFGPWKLRHDHTAKDARTRIEVDADEHDPSTLVFTRDAAGASVLEAHLHKGPVRRFGIASPTLDASGDLVAEAEGRVAWSSPPTSSSPTSATAPGPATPAAAIGEGAITHVDGSIAATLHGLPLPGVGGAGDMTFDLAVAGDPARPLPITRGTFVVGPFEGDVSGAVTARASGAHADLAFKSRPVPCARFAAEQAAAALGPLAGLAGPGITRAVSGNISVSGTLVLDTDDPGATRLAAHPASDCGISISLGAP